MSADVKQQEATRQPHRWKKGESGNPYGRPKSPEAEELRQALRVARKKNGNKGLVQHFVERAYNNDQVLIAIMKKLLPESSEQTTNIINQIYANGITAAEKEHSQKLVSRLDKLLTE